MKKEWIKEIARDSLALGSIPFYLIVIIRAIVGQYPIFVYQLLIALVVLFVFGRIVRKSNMHIARCFVLWVFTSLFYKDNLYTVFAFLLWVFVVVSARYLKIRKMEITKGVVIGIICAPVTYYLAFLIP